ncbi:hypothetical protein [Staphylococcus nepalensis]
MKELKRSIYSLADFGTTYDDDEQENAFAYLIEDEHDSIREERNME